MSTNTRPSIFPADPTRASHGTLRFALRSLAQIEQDGGTLSQAVQDLRTGWQNLEKAADVDDGTQARLLDSIRTAQHPSDMATDLATLATRTIVTPASSALGRV